MKKVNLLLVGIVSVFFSLTACAVAPELKIGLVDFQKVMQELPKAKEIKSRLEKQFASEKSKIEKKQKSLEALGKKLKKEGSVIQAKEKKSLQAQIEKEKGEMLSMLQGYQTRVMQAEQTELQDIFKEINGLVEKVAKKNKMDLVLQNVIVAYADKRFVDITSQVIKAGK